LKIGLIGQIAILVAWLLAANIGETRGAEAALDIAKISDAGCAISTLDIGQPASKLQLGTMDIRTTYGTGGSTRPAEIIAGEVLHLLITVSNVGLTSKGKLAFWLDGNMVDATGKVNQQFFLWPVSDAPWLGGVSARKTLNLSIPRNLAAGTYQFHFKACDGQGVERARPKHYGSGSSLRHVWSNQYFAFV